MNETVISSCFIYLKIRKLNTFRLNLVEIVPTITRGIRQSCVTYDLRLILYYYNSLSVGASGDQLSLPSAKHL